MKTIMPQMTSASVIAFVAISMQSKSAFAQNVWVQDNGGGCATSITVSANNLPVVIGCDTPVGYPGPIVYYSNQVLDRITQNLTWYPAINPINGINPPAPEPKYIYANMNGETFVTDVNGAIWWADGPGTGNGGFTGQWNEVPSGGCVGSFVASYAQPLEGAPATVAFDTPVEFQEVANVWGVGCDPNSTNNSNLYMLSMDWVATPGFDGYLGSLQWTRMGGSGARASLIAFFTDLESGVTQNPWVVNTEGYLYFFNGSGFSSAPNAPANITYATDHYILTGSSSTPSEQAVYYWNGTNVGGGNTSWTNVIGGLPGPYGITQIAWSQAVTGTPNGTIGPSDLWAIDSAGNIYYMAHQFPLQ
jgi:hypothetical protein